MASTTAQRRLLQEYRALTNNPPEGITAGPVSEGMCFPCLFTKEQLPTLKGHESMSS